VLEHPPPTALFVAFGASSLDFCLRIWTQRQEVGQLKSDLGVSIYRVLGDAGIEIPFPQTDLHVYADTASQMLGGASVNVQPRRTGSR
jgi:small-conductance mechanosensitive channel